jgi:hypothetical protein
MLFAGVGLAASAPTCDAGKTAAMTPGLPYQLDGSASVSNNNSPSLSYYWQQLNGHSTVNWNSRTVAKPIITGIVGGAYRFQLTVTDSDGSTSSCTLGPVAIATSAGAPRKVTVGFQMASVPNARQVRCTLLKHDATTVVVSTASSPCVLTDDSPQLDKRFVRLEYLAADGSVLAQTEKNFKERAPHFTHISTGFGNFDYRTWPQALSDAIFQWKADRFDGISEGTGDPRPFNPNVLWAMYLDHAFCYSYEINRTVKDVAAQRGFVYEDMLLHSSTNYLASQWNWVGKHYVSWTDMEQFDAFENDGTPKKGVFLVNGSNYTDVTTASYDTNAADVSITDKLLLGYGEPFDEINFVLSTVGAGVNVEWQYWNGSSYSPLRPTADGTNGLTRDGKIRFGPPPDWTVKAENGSRAKYWVRAVVSGAGTRPVASRIYGAGWQSIPLADQRQLGFTSKFGEVNVTLRNPATGVTPTWQYWNGSAWAPLNITKDTTSGLITDGKIAFTPPADWVSQSGWYYLKLVLTGQGNSALAGRLWPEAFNYYLRHDNPTDAMGWAAKDSNIVNKGMGPLEYNPNPPASASARFRYQSRTTGVWAENANFGNPSNQQNGVPSWGQRNVDVVHDEVLKNLKDGVGFDDGGTLPNVPQQYLDVDQGKDITDQLVDLLKWERDELRRVFPGFQTSVNGVNDKYGKAVDLITHENNFHAYVMTPPMSLYAGWDGPSNPYGTHASYQCMDTLTTVFDFTMPVWRYWDKGNFGPMNCLAMHYLASNPYISYSYNPNGYIYNETDDYYYWVDTPTTLTSAITNGRFTTLAADLMPQFNWNAKEVPVVDISPFPTNGSEFWVRVGEAGPAGRLMKSHVSNGKLITSAGFYYPTVPAGTKVTFLDNPGGFTIPVASTSGMGIAPPRFPSNIVLRIGDPGPTSGDIVTATLQNGRLVTSDSIANDYPTGTPVYWVQVGHQAVDQLPPISRIFKWGPWHPAIGVDVGLPDANGYNGGAADLHWKSGADITSDLSICANVELQGFCGDMARRDFTKAIILVRPGAGGDPIPKHTNSWMDGVTPSKPVCINPGDTYPSCTGPDYYPLFADGTTGTGTRSAVLRGLEGAIFMKAPVAPQNPN